MAARSTRFLAVAVVVIATALGLAVYLFRSGDVDDRWQTVKDRASGITVAYPSEWKVQTFGRYCRRVGPGVLVANAAGHTFRNVEILNGCTNQWDFTGLSPQYVVIDASLFSAPLGRGGPATTMPLELARFKQQPSGYTFTRVRRNNNDYSVRVWFGSTASREDQEAAERVIRSLDFGLVASP